MKKKIIVSALSLAIGAGLAGSITSTAAWYQYSTKVQAAVLGVAGGVKGNLQMRFKQDGQGPNDNWVTRINKSEMDTYLGAKKIVPVTSGTMDRKDSVPTLYCNPVYGYGAQDSWKEAAPENYIKIQLELRFVESNDTASQNLAKDIYLSDLFIAQDASDTSDHGDISSAVRFHMSAFSQAAPTTKVNRLVSRDGGIIDTHGYLDLNGDGEDDVDYGNDKSAKYGFTTGTGEKIDYGYDSSATNKQTSYAAAVQSQSAYPILADISNGAIEADKKLGTTLTASDQFLEIDVTIWVEGWQKLPEGNSGEAIWDVEDFVKAKFDVGFEFEATESN